MYKVIGQSVENNDFSVYVISQFSHIHIHTHIRLSENLPLLYKHNTNCFILHQGSNEVYQYLSGVAITPQTQFLQLGQPEVMEEFKLVIHYMRYALAAYGWPGFMMINGGIGLCKMLPNLR